MVGNTQIDRYTGPTWLGTDHRFSPELSQRLLHADSSKLSSESQELSQLNRREKGSEVEEQ